MRDGCKVKICGITNQEDRDLTAELGADFFGVIVDVPYSPRTLNMETAASLLKDAPLPGVALVFQKNLQQIENLVELCQPQAVQFLSPVPLEWLQELKMHFPEVGWWQSLFLPAAEINTTHPDIKELQLQMQELARAGADVLIIDTAVKRAGKTRYGGTGQTSNWELACSLVETSPLPVFLAGGIKPSNIMTALDIVRPQGIDLCSGVEVRPGRKDPAKLQELIDLVRIWEKNNNCRKDER
ncbi:MAG: phosphoribosylanthranilate isomerase [Syntrophaceticus sp.]